MKSADILRSEQTKKIHYLFLGKNFKKTKNKLEKSLKYYTLVFSQPFKGYEIIYDVPSNLLSNAGIVLSKQFEEDKYFFKVRKISNMPGGYKKPSQKFNLGESEKFESPKDFPLQIANAISNLYSNVFTIDLVSIVRQTQPKYEIVVKGDIFKVVGGTGYRAKLLYEKAYYKDLLTNKKVKRVGLTLVMPTDEKFEKENKTVVQTIDHFCKELVGYEQSRFEIAQRLLNPNLNSSKDADKSEKEN